MNKLMAGLLVAAVLVLKPLVAGGQTAGDPRQGPLC